MAKIQRPLLSLDATGTLGNMLGFVRAPGAAVARSIARIRADALAGRKRPATAGQTPVRARWSAGCLAWSALSEVERATYRATAEPLGLTGFNLFMRQYQEPPTAAPTLLAAVAKTFASNNSTGTSAPIDTTGAGKLLIALLHADSPQYGTVSDSMDNSYTQIGDYTISPGTNLALFESSATTPATSQTHTFEGYHPGNGYPTILVAAVAPTQGATAVVAATSANNDAASPYESNAIATGPALLLGIYAPYLYGGYTLDLTHGNGFAGTAAVASGNVIEGALSSRRVTAAGSYSTAVTDAGGTPTNVLNLIIAIEDQ